MGSIAEALGSHVSSSIQRCDAVGHNALKYLEKIHSELQDCCGRPKRRQWECRMRAIHGEERDHTLICEQQKLFHGNTAHSSQIHSAIIKPQVRTGQDTASHERMHGTRTKVVP